MGAIICFAMAVVNVVFMAILPGGSPINCAAAVICFGLGLAITIMESRR